MKRSAPGGARGGANGRRQRADLAAEIAAAVAHEIRTPLATALMYLGLAERELEALERASRLRSAIATARVEIARTEQLVGRIAEMQGLGFPVMRPSLIDVGSVVTETVRRTVAGAAARLVHLEIGGGDLTDWWDEIAVGQIVQNLVSNAIKFGEGRPVEVIVERTEHHAQLSVRDRGLGLTPSTRARILRRRAHAPVPRAPGLGLGLWLVRSLVEAHRGTVGVRSQPGDGSTFTVTLRPLRPAR